MAREKQFFKDWESQSELNDSDLFEIVKEIQKMVH